MEPVKTPKLLELLSARYSGSEWAFLDQVRGGTAWTASRTADAIAMNMWPSRAMIVEGFELKVSRSDWLHELKDPAKSSEIMEYCDKWWLVVGNPDIVKIEELPINWGLIVCTGERLKTIKEAPVLQPKPLDRHFIASVLRNVTCNMVAKGVLENRIVSEVEKRTNSFKERMEREIQSYKYKYDNLVEQVQKFEVSSGVKIQNSWYLGDIGASVKYVMEHGEVKIKRDMENYKQSLLRIVTEIDKELTKPTTSLTGNLPDKDNLVKE